MLPHVQYHLRLKLPQTESRIGIILRRAVCQYCTLQASPGTTQQDLYMIKLHERFPCLGPADIDAIDCVLCQVPRPSTAGHC